MFAEFVSQNLPWFAAFAVVLTLLIMSFIQESTSGAKMVSALELPQLQRNGNDVILDVSSSSEFTNSHIPDSKNFPVETIESENGKLVNHKEKTVIVVCQTGNKSLKAAKHLLHLGFNDVHILRGGMMSWTKENLPIATG